MIKSRQSLAEKQPGTTIFPMARLKKIVKADKDLDMMTTEAVFLVGVATEYFIKHFMEEGYTKARLEKRRIVNYRDMANVVARSDEFGFLSGEYLFHGGGKETHTQGKDVSYSIRIAQIGPPPLWWGQMSTNLLTEPACICCVPPRPHDSYLDDCRS